MPIHGVISPTRNNSADNPYYCECCYFHRIIILNPKCERTVNATKQRENSSGVILQPQLAQLACLLAGTAANCFTSKAFKIILSNVEVKDKDSLNLILLLILKDNTILCALVLTFRPWSLNKN